MNTQLSGQVALIAGGTGGLGKAVSLAMLEAGTNVIVTYRKAEEFSALQSAAGENGRRLEGSAVDVTNEVAVNQLIEKALAKHSRLDVLINTVGGYTGGKKFW